VKDWTVFLVCLLVSFGFWLVMMLSRSSTDAETIPVIAVSNIEGYSERSADIVDVAARCNAAGFRHLMMAVTTRAVEVEFAAEDMISCGDGVFQVNPSALYKYSKDIFGAKVVVESFVTGDLKFNFNEEVYKKVPVVPSTDIKCLPQYIVQGEVKLQPDSVLVYGDPKLTENISSVMTRMISQDEVRKDLHGTVKLEAPTGMRLSEDEVSYSVSVRRFVEFRRRVPVAVRNVPEGVNFTFLPRTVEAVVKAGFPVKQNPFDVLEFYVDYQDFEKSLTGQCVIRLANSPKDLISWTVKPEICNCVVQR